MLDVHNNNLFAWDQIAAVFLANTGTVPNLFHQYIFNLIGTKNNTDLLKSNELEKYLFLMNLAVSVKLKPIP